MCVCVSVCMYVLIHELNFTAYVVFIVKLDEFINIVELAKLSKSVFVTS